MTNAETQASTSGPRPRLWPGVVAVALQWLVWQGVSIFAPDYAMYGILGGAMGGGLAVLVWWLFFSRVPWIERLVPLALMPAAVYATKQVVHPSIAGAGMGMLLPIFSIPVLCLALVVWAALRPRLSGAPHWAALVGLIALGCGVFTLARTGGVRGEGGSQVDWRWNPSPEERLLAQGPDDPAPRPAAPAAAPPAAASPAPAGVVAKDPAKAPTTAAPAAKAASAPTAPTAPTAAAPAPAAAAVTPASDAPAEWPGFRGPDRDGLVRGAPIATDWAKSPPAEIWRRKIGPGWSSFAVQGHVVYTQEQRGEDELVSSYDLETGNPVWRHRDAARFWESNAGAGPRGSPTVAGGRVYTLGATGIVNALDAHTGAKVWSRDAAADTGAKVPDWGFSGSPLVVGDLVVVAASGRLAGYDVGTGDLRWTMSSGRGSYSSPHLVSIGGVTQVLLMTNAGLTSVSPQDGAVLWEHKWEGSAIIQPARTSEGDLLISTGGGGSGGAGTRRLAVSRGPAGWTVDERWTSVGLKPYFSDLVAHEGHVYGFDGSILACIDLAEGKRKWKGGRYGNGQLVLLADQDLLLVLAETGELALVRATPDQFTELARIPAIEGKSWNHPVVVRNVLLVRNDEEMAAFRLPPAP